MKQVTRFQAESGETFDTKEECCLFEADKDVHALVGMTVDDALRLLEGHDPERAMSLERAGRRQSRERQERERQERERAAAATGRQLPPPLPPTDNSTNDASAEE